MRRTRDRIKSLLTKALCKVCASGVSSMEWWRQSSALARRTHAHGLQRRTCRRMVRRPYYAAVYVKTASSKPPPVFAENRWLLLTQSGC